MRFQIERHIKIRTPAVKIYNLIADLKRWPDWSPWSVGRNHIVKFSWSDDGKSYTWDDEIIGRGMMSKTVDTENKLSFDLHFEKPFKSTATTCFFIESINDHSCKLTWQMDGNMPWFLFFLIPTMKGAISLDYWNGLNMLKHLAEDGHIGVNYGDVSTENYERMYVVGKIVRKCPMHAVTASQPDFKSLQENITKYGETIHPINTYQNFDIKTHIFDFMGGYTVTNETFESMKKNYGEHYDYLTLEKGRAVKMKFTGNYVFIGNAWSILSRYIRFKKYKSHPTLSGFEIYRKHPFNEETKERYETDIYMAIQP